MATSKASARTSKKATDSVRTVLETAPKAALLMLFTGLFILLISTLLCLGLPSPASFSQPIAYLSLFIGVLIGGYFCSKRIGTSSSFACAALAAMILTVIFTVMRSIFPESISVSNATLRVFGHFLAAGASLLGVMIGNRTNNKKRRKKHYRS